MRSIKEFNIQQIKCTLFLHNMKYTLQMEDERYLFSFKLGNKDARDILEIEDVVHRSNVIQYLLKSFSILHDTRLIIENELNIAEDEFEQVII